MSSAFSFLGRHVAAGEHRRAGWIVLAALHLAAIAVLFWSETDFVSRLAFVLAWALLNFFLLVVLCRPAPAAALSLTLIAILILLSRFKHGVLLMTVNFLDLLIVDPDTFSFLLIIFPNLSWMIAAAVAVIVPLVVLLWSFDPLRLRLRTALLGMTTCLASLTALSLATPSDLYEEFSNNNYVSKFARSGVTGTLDLFTRGYLDSDAVASERLSGAAGDSCHPPELPPHIVMVFDESSYDISMVPGVDLPQNYRQHFQSFDGKQRRLLVEGAGGPSWYTEYNVLTGLSARSYGRFADFVTRIAAGRVERGLPHALRGCGYKTFSLYPMWGSFAGARAFQQSAGVEHFLDAKDLGTRGIEPDAFYYDYAAKLIAQERGEQPLFLFVYTAANHFPWNFRFRPDLTPDWHQTRNSFEVDEYLRRQAMSARDYRAFINRLARDLPGERILVVRFGDHQPSFAKHLLDPKLDESVLARRIAEADPRFLTTYYAIEGVNFRPVGTSAALDVLDAPYLPIVAMEAAGLTLDASFAEQRRILRRCKGLFYRCAGGAEARRFNRLLIDAGLIKNL